METTKKLNDMWEPILQDFIQWYPHIADRVIDWYPCGHMRIVLRLDDGEKKTYDFIDHRLNDVPTDMYEDDSDEEWKKRFAERLKRKLFSVGISQWQLSEKTGISEVAISKYLRCKAIPSAYNIDKLARALKCDISELMQDI